MSAPPLLLAFDVSGPIGSVAVGSGARILARAFLPRSDEHAGQLLPEISAALSRAGVSRGEVEGIVVGKGPGSFTGVRVGAATARGLSVGWGIPLWARSSLAAAAASDGVQMPDEAIAAMEGADRMVAEALEDGQPRYILFDARGDRLYAACYRLRTDAVETLVEPHATTVGNLLEGALPSGVRFAGSGALCHADRLEAAGYSLLAPPVGVPTAEGLLRIQGLGAADPPEPRESRWEPEYLRGSWALQPAAPDGR